MADEQYEILVEELDEAACCRLVSREAFGRIGFVHGGEVIVLPVNAVVMANRVVFRTADDTMVSLAGNGSVVAFQSDYADRITETGWSVLVHGRLWDITDAPETDSFHELSVRPLDVDRTYRRHRSHDSPQSNRVKPGQVAVHDDRLTGRPSHRASWTNVVPVESLISVPSAAKTCTPSIGRASTNGRGGRNRLGTRPLGLHLP